MRPRRAGRPVIAVLARNDATEMTDFLLPHAVLRRAGVADVQAVAPRGGTVRLYPAFEVDGVQDFAAFDEAHPAGSDYVIVPAMSRDDDPAIATWLVRQTERGARVVGVCAGAIVLARAGLLDGRRFTTHWYYRGAVLARARAHSAVYVPNRRYVLDGDVATSTGITASVPTMLALVEAIGGRDRAAAVAAELGVSSWNPAHDSSLFGLTAKRAWRYSLNKAAFWRRERWAAEVRYGMDDVALAFAADAWSRTGRVRVAASAAGPVTLLSGMVLAARPAPRSLEGLPLDSSLAPVQQLDRTLSEIADRFGAARREWVRMELEYAAE
jgi:transcriptional regulator GlxA family with amidase domain